MKKKGFSLTELLMVIVVLGTLGALTIPNFQKTLYKEKARQAKSYLNLIRMGEKTYYQSQGEYIACSNITDINSKLNVELTDENFSFNVTTGSNNSTFLATATPKESAIGNIYMNQTGVAYGSKYI